MIREPSRLTGVLGALVLSRLGGYAEAGDALKAVRRTYESNGWPEGLASIDLTRATWALERGRCEDTARGVAAAEASLASSLPDASTPWRMYADVLAGTCAARDGRLDEAQRRLDQARQIHRANAALETWWLAALEGEVSLARGDPGGALRAFAAGSTGGRLFFNRNLFYFSLSMLANNLIVRDLPARVAAAQGRTDEAIAIYRRLLTSGAGQPYTAVPEPRYVLALAQQLDRAGDKKAARAEYRRFLDLWKTADKGSPEIAAARAALTR